MAQKVIVTKIDDLDPSIEGGEATGLVIETIPFALDGVAYEIDLGPDNASRLRNDLADFRAKARKVTGATTKRSSGVARVHSTGTGGSGAGSNYTSAQRKEIRSWAIDNGADIGERGRLPDSVYAAWEDNRNTTKLPRKQVEAGSAAAIPQPQFTG
jgi:hypothetical protein